MNEIWDYGNMGMENGNEGNMGVIIPLDMITPLFTLV